MKSSLIHMFFFLIFFCFSVDVNSQSSDSCSSNLAVTKLIPFNTSSLSCFSALQSSNFILRYGKAGQNLWSFVLSAADPGSYISVGFSSDGRMVGSSAVAGWMTSAGGAGVAKQYSLNGKSSGNCPPDRGSLQLSGTPVITKQSSRLYLAFQLKATQPPPYLIFAVGPSSSIPSSNNLLPVHSSQSSYSVNYANGGASNPVAGGGNSGDDDDSDGNGDSGGGGGGSRNSNGVSAVEVGGTNSFGKKRQHGALVILGWGVLMPIGLAIARYFKHWDPQWFYSHLAIQVFGFVLGLIGIIIGFGLEGDGISGFDIHQALGIAILVGGCLQVTALLARPDKASKVRKYWNMFHHNVGRATIILAIANIFFGLKLTEEAKIWSLGFGIFLGALGLITVFLEVRLLTRDH